MSANSDFMVIYPKGVLTATTAPQLHQQIKECLEAKTKIVLINMQEVDFVDSSGLGNLVSIYTKLKLADVRLYFCSLKDQARSLFDISDMDRIFEVLLNEADFQSRIIKKNQAILIQ